MFLPQVVQALAAKVLRYGTQFLFDAEELVVLADTVGAAGGTGLDLARVGRNGDVSDGAVLGLAGTVRDDGGVTGALGHFDGVERLGQRADLVDLDEDGVANPQVNALLEELGVGNEQIVANQLDFFAQDFGHFLEAVPVVFVQAVFDGKDRVLGAQFGVVVDHELGIAQLTFELVAFFLFAVEGGSGGVEGDGDVFTGDITGFADGFENHVDGFGVGAEVGGETALIADCRVEAFAGKHFFQGVENFRAATKGFGEVGSLGGLNHEFLNINVVVRVLAAVDDVHHGHGQDFGIHAADVLVQGKAQGVRRCAGNGHRNAEDGIRAQFALGLGAVEVDHDLVNEGLLGGVHVDDFGGDEGVDIVNSLQRAFAEVTGFIAVAQFEGFVFAGGCAGRNSGATHSAGFEQNFNFEGGVAARVQNFACVDINDSRHVGYFLLEGDVRNYGPFTEKRERRKTDNRSFAPGTPFVVNVSRIRPKSQGEEEKSENRNYPQIARSATEHKGDILGNRNSMTAIEYRFLVEDH
jgi:hypothetical protein